MKYLKTFENFEVNEWFGQEFFTGHQPGGKENAKKRIEEEIESAIAEYNEHPEDFFDYDLDILRDELLQSAKENGYRGGVEVIQSTDDPRAAHSNKFFIVYQSENTPLQDIGSIAGRELRR